MKSINFDESVSYHYDKFPPQNIDLNIFISELLGATAAFARYDQVLKNMHNSEILLAPLRNQEAVISSRMEGTVSTMDEILKYQADEINDPNSINSYRGDVLETLLYQRSLINAQKALEDGYKISSSTVKKIHQQLLSFGRGANKSPGQFKSEQNYLADKVKQKILFTPISPERLEEGLEILFDYLNNSNDLPLIKTALMHLEFEALHPFKDGNGRIGRMLITLYLWSDGLITAPHFYISEYFEENKDEYIDTMRSVSSNGNWEEWCKFFFKGIEEQANRNLEIAESITELYENMKTVFSDLLSSKYCIIALDYIFTNPIFRNSNFTSKSGIPPATAQRFTRTLAENNLIEIIEEASGRRPALYSFEPLMKLVRV
ncbi:Fic family protein [Sphingobacterium sp. DK4209]|uniref:Fic family protein n=1 Tax=Sphingobacterium zhuxiongii TaxID=2662364 RepID=A0A5Q0QE76_9SPHI|nr:MULTISPECIES: Fic family protein [unclassified Sphingobacterium]MVZ66513.1 Fic family protein [Sphingobacterium sp. DK4209]QGA27833.1 Fic family protein [Sphingobacterium sp. dk4302]